MKLFSVWTNWAEKHTILGGISYAVATLVVFVAIVLVWGIASTAIHGDPAFDKCMAEYNDHEFCITAPAR